MQKCGGLRAPRSCDEDEGRASVFSLSAGVYAEASGGGTFSERGEIQNQPAAAGNIDLQPPSFKFPRARRRGKKKKQSVSNQSSPFYCHEVPTLSAAPFVPINAVVPLLLLLLLLSISPLEDTNDRKHLNTK